MKPGRPNAFSGELYARSARESAIDNLPLMLLCVIISLAPLPVTAEEPQAEITQTLDPCSRGFCAADKDGRLLFWASPGPDGELEPGFEDLHRLQQGYNEWAKERFRHLVYTNQTRGGWEGESIIAPERLPEDGRVHPDTLMIPVYRYGAEILSLWQRWRNDCLRAEFSHHELVCEPKINANAPLPKRQILAGRAERLRRAYHLSREYETKVKALYIMLIEVKDRNRQYTRLDLTRLQPGTIEELSLLLSNVETELAVAVGLEWHYIFKKDPLD